MEEIRPLLSGIIGAIIAFLLARALCKSFPDNYSEERLEDVRSEYGTQSRVLNLLSVFGFSSGLALYFLDLLPRNDWRGFGVALGLTAMLPLLFLAVVVVRESLNRAVHVLNAFARIQHTPRVLMYSVLFFFLLTGAIAVFSLIADA